MKRHAVDKVKDAVAELGRAVDAGIPEPPGIRKAWPRHSSRR